MRNRKRGKSRGRRIKTKINRKMRTRYSKKKKNRVIIPWKTILLASCVNTASTKNALFIHHEMSPTVPLVIAAALLLTPFSCSAFTPTETPFSTPPASDSADMSAPPFALLISVAEPGGMSSKEASLFFEVVDVGFADRVFAPSATAVSSPPVEI